MSDSIWGRLGGLLVDKGLPLLGAAVGGPAGASLGGLVASALGGSSSEPEELFNVIQNASPELIAQLKELEYKHKERLEELSFQRYEAELKAGTQRIESVNQTMRVEATSQGLPSLWRPIWGIVSAAAFLIVCCGLVGMMFVKPSEFPAAASALAQMEFFWLIPLTILGVASWHRGKEKRVMAGEQTGGLTQIAAAMVGKRNG